ncbi:putative zinc finger domain-containing protein [Rosellinia necatrix]|uniref:Putative zinc finger domain-containing protein n=1 Tax=Rosellinia necatrix TaxID=77044 RepID=A0A1S8A9A3_ROSNE|nr:putative zinc finger domain-containing protein [Rosellinia necatrix]
MMQPCRFYLTAGGCRLGQLCRSPHVDPAAQGQTESNALGAQQPNQQTDGKGRTNSSTQPSAISVGDQRFYQWRRMIPRQPADPSATFGRRLPQFFQLGLVLVGGDIDVLQGTIKLMASEGGLLSIRELVDNHIPSCRSGAARIGLWRACVRPLFAMLTEVRVTRSTLLEMSTGAIYNAILGYNASRLRPLYYFLICIADNWHTPIISEQDGRKSEFFELCTSILARIIDCNTQALVNEAVPPIVKCFRASINSLKSHGSEFWILQADKNIEYIQKRLSIVKGAAQPQSIAACSLTRAKFVIRRDLPGELSTEGPRHDNDHADCTKIRILPTISEIMSTRQDYRPFHDPSQLHIPGVQGLIDRHFRLLRDDMVGQLKEVISYELNQLTNPQIRPIEKNGVRTYSYQICDIVNITCNRRYGLQFHLQIEQPFRPNPRSAMNCEEYWTVSRRLEAGALVCVLQKSTAIFCVVSESTVRPDPNRPKAQKTNEGAQGSTKRNLYGDKDYSYVNLCLAEPQTADVEVMIRAFKSGLSSQRVLVEFPGILLASFQSILVALQQIYKTADLPFSEILAPNEDGPETLTIPPPLYSTKPGFSFNLKSITNGGEGLFYVPNTALDPELLTSQSQLDHGQAVACLNTLRRAFQAILKVLLDNTSAANSGPILCVCYTNHALDQLLEHLWHRGITQIVRIGKRSKSTLLEDVNLKKLAQDIERTKEEKRDAYHQVIKLVAIENEFQACLDRMKNATSAKAIKEHLGRCGESALQTAIFGTEAEEGWTKVTFQDDNESLHTWVCAGTISQDIPRPINILRVLPSDSLSRQERQALCHVWASELMEDHVEQFLSLEADHRQAKHDFEAVRREVELRVLSQCKIVGVTTTGLASNLDLLRKVNSKILLCEEAGEVLESHILTALLPSLEHVILIGDHLQLRPQVANYDLSVDNPSGHAYALDVSLFERLVKPVHPNQPKLPFDTLNIQRRMHPCISTLIRETIYPDLEDASHLSNYPEVVGMRKRLFWFDHDNPESRADPTQPLSTSRTNNFEVEMVAALVSHLVRQGVYAHDQIAVLTPYLGQLYELRKRLRNTFEIVLGDRDIKDLDRKGLGSDTENPTGVQKEPLGKCLTLATVDNFQGEEAEIVVISLAISAPSCRFNAHAIRARPSRSEASTILRDYHLKQVAIFNVASDATVAILALVLVIQRFYIRL